MSDAEGGKKSGYRLEYAPTGRGKCNGPKPCKGTPIGKGELRVGSLVDFRGNTSFQWRHWGCVTPKIIANMKSSFEEADELDGFDELKEEDQERVRKAWEEGKVADEDIPESARKGSDDEGDEDEDEDKPKKKKAAAKVSKKKAAEEDDGTPKKGVFKLEYASSGRAKCKVCGEQVGKDFFRLGNEVDFRGNKAFAWRHWGCTDDKMVASMKASYDDASEIDGFSELKSGEQEKVKRAWEDGEVPEEDKGPGEAVDTGKKKAPARRKKKEEDGEEAEKPKKRGRKPKKSSDEEEEEEEEKPKRKRAPAKKEVAEKKAKAPAKKRAAKKKSSDEDELSGEDFGDEIAAVGDEEEEDGEDEEPVHKKQKRAPVSKASSSKPPSKRGKPASTRGRKKQEEIPEESEPEDDE